MIDDFVRTVDLMKKGLRRTGRPQAPQTGVRTVDLMKKGLRRVARYGNPEVRVRTVDLMKKGLRPYAIGYHPPGGSEP